MDKRMDRKAREAMEAQLLKQLKNCVNEERFDEALEIINQIDVGRIKVAPNMCLIGEVYMQMGMFDKAENLFVKAYDRSPSNRRILNLLTSLYIEMGDYSEAEYYYKEFIGVASRDLHRYILRYRLDKAKGERTAVLIDTLERLKDYEYIEEWAYELAELYHRSGDDKKAIHECDEIVLWFGHGEFVNRALRLKSSITGEDIPLIDEDFMSAYNGGGEDSDNSMRSGVTDVNFDIGLVEQALQEQQRKVQQEYEDEIYAAMSDSENQSSTDGDVVEFDLASVLAEDSEADISSTNVIADSVYDDEEADSVAEPIQTENSSLFDALSVGDSMEFWGKEGGKERRIFGLFKREKADKPNTEDLLEEDFDEEDLIEENFDKKDLLEEDFDEEDLIEENFDEADLLEEDFDEEDLIEEDFDEEDLIEEDFDEEDLIEEFFDEADLIEEDCDEEDLVMENSDNNSKREWTDDDQSFIDQLFDSPKPSGDLFAAVPAPDYVKEQLTMTFTKFADAEIAAVDILAPYDINFVVVAEDKSLKSQIALGIAKALNTYGKCDKRKVVRTKAKDLNKIDFSKVFDKLKDGCLIIEKADLLSDESVKIIEDYVNKENQQTAIVLSSIADEIPNFWRKHPALRAKFLNVINVGKYNEMELVTLTKGYIEQRKYELDPDAALVLRDYFKACLDANIAVDYEDVTGIVDTAISNLENRNRMNLFMTVLDNKYEEAKMFRLLAEDFTMLQPKNS